MLKPALVEALDRPDIPAPLLAAGRGILSSFLNDNTSPETHSFHIVAIRRESGYGNAVAVEAAKRYLLTQLPVEFVNAHYLGIENGQRAVVFASPNPPLGQKELNDCIPDAFYRQLFISPCLSGWDQGEEITTLHGTVPRGALAELPERRL